MERSLLNRLSVFGLTACLFLSISDGYAAAPGKNGDCWKSAACVTESLKVGVTTTAQAEAILGKNYELSRENRVSSLSSDESGRARAVEKEVWHYPRQKGSFLSRMRNGAGNVISKTGDLANLLGGKAGGRVMDARNDMADPVFTAGSKVDSANSLMSRDGSTNVRAKGDDSISSLSLWFENGVLVSFDGS